MKVSRDAVVVPSRDFEEVVDVLCDAFEDYPVMRFVLGDAGAYDRRLRRLVGFFVKAREVRGEMLLGVPGPDGLIAAAIVSNPHGPPAPPSFQALREAVWNELGAEPRKRYEAFGAACAPFLPAEPHLHLNMIGVRGSAQGHGLGRLLLGAVHDLSLRDSASSGVSLTTEDEANVALYQHFGYSVVGEAEVGPGLRSWSFFRADPTDAGGTVSESPPTAQS